MNFGYSDRCLDHETGPRHPESPDRLRAIREGLKRRHSVRYVAADPVDRDALSTVHDESYLDAVEKFCAEGGGNWDPDTVAVEDTWDAIKQSAGLACWAAKAALDGDDGRETPFAIGRPPGHHAVVDDAMGFCFVNNVAVAAEAALNDSAETVAIFDWDVHHGNGTQDIFNAREDVFFASIHEEGIYPGTGAASEAGQGPGSGTTLNIPMPAGAGDAGYLFAIDRLITPAIRSFDPDLLLISAGFDAHEHDPISRTQVSTAGYAHLANAASEMADETDAALSFVLEGGYGLDVLAESVSTVHEVFDGYEPPPVDSDPTDAVQSRISAIESSHQAFR